MKKPLYNDFQRYLATEGTLDGAIMNLRIQLLKFVREVKNKVKQRNQ